MFIPFSYTPGFQPGRILWITNAPPVSDSGQVDTINALTNAGFTVVQGDDAGGTYFPNDWQALYIHEDVASNTAWNNLDSATRSTTSTGICVSENALIDEILDCASGFSWTGNDLMLMTAEAPYHPITRNFASGTAYSLGDLSARSNGISVGGGKVLALFDQNPSHSPLIVFEKGELSANSNPQPGRRVFIGTGNSTGTLNSTGVEITARAIRWCAGDTRL